MIEPCQPSALIGVGSNIAPETNVCAALQRLLDRGRWLAVSRVIRTTAVGLEAGAPPFLNLAAVLPWGDAPYALVTFLKAIEAELGRDMDHPRRAHRSRPIDLDLIDVAADVHRWSANAVPSDPWIRPVALEVIAHLDDGAEAPADLPEGVALSLGDISFGLTATTLRAR